MMKRLKATVLVFTILILTNWSANAQNDSTSTCTGIHYTIDQDRAAQECWENHAERQAITKELEAALAFLNGEYKLVRIELATVKEENVELTEDNTKLKKKVKRNRWGWITTGIAGTLGIVITSTLK